MPKLPAADRTAVSALEQGFFDRLAKGGIDTALTWQFTQIANESNLTEDHHKQFRGIDSSCGTLTSIERYRTESFGSRAVHDYFMAVQGSCVIKWRLTYAKVGTSWSFRGFNIQSSNGDEWDY